MDLAYRHACSFNLAKKYGIFLRAGKRLILRCAKFPNKKLKQSAQDMEAYMLRFLLVVRQQRNFLKTLENFLRQLLLCFLR